jgi:hypothetical protein
MRTYCGQANFQQKDVGKKNTVGANSLAFYGLKGVNSKLHLSEGSSSRHILSVWQH